jgi:molybdopterin-guanine dinucleotide biosynthesis protein A
VLAGGRATRFGGDKLAAVFEGRPLLDHAVGRLREVCDDVVVVIAPGAPAPALAGEEARVVHDDREGEGPLAGALAGLEAVGADLAVIVGGDMPRLSVAVVAEMLRSARDLEGDAVALRDGDRMRPLPCVVRVGPARVAARNLLRGGERSLRALLAALGAEAVDEATWTALDPARGTLFDVDEPADLDG